MMKGIYKRGNTYWFRYMQDGKQRFTSLKTKDPKLAEKAAIKIQAAVFEDRWFPKAKTIDLDALCEHWSRKKNDSPSVWGDISRMKHLFAFFGKNKRIDKIERTDVLGWVAYLEKQNFANSTINNYVKFLKALLNYAHRLGFEHKDPCIVYDLKPEQIRERIITEEELRNLLSVIKKRHIDLNAIILLSYFSAFRLSEMLSLDWKQVDLDKKLIHLPGSKTKNSKPRSVPIHKEALDFLLAHFEPKSEGTIFKTGRSTIGAQFRRYADMAGLPDVVIHSLRHTAITNFTKKGVNPLVVQKISGHTTMRMLERYSHLDTEDVQRAMERLG